jgi:DNA mismatch repair protein MutS
MARGLLGGVSSLAELRRKKTASGLDGIRTKTAVEEWVFTAEYAVPLVRNHLQVHSLDGMGLGWA